MIAPSILTSNTKNEEKKIQNTTKEVSLFEHFI